MTDGAGVDNPSVQSFGAEWQIWSLVAIVGITIAAAVLVHLSGRRTLPVLPLPHVAAAALVGVLSWDGLLNLPNIITTFDLTYAGIANAPEMGAYQAFVAASTVYVVAGAVAVFGLLRRQAWAVVLGIGICVARLAMAGIGVTQMLSLASEGMAPEFAWFAITVGLHAVPAVAAIVLLAWPFTRGADRSEADIANLERERRDGIVDAASTDADGVEWPDWSPPAPVRREGPRSG